MRPRDLVWLWMLPPALAGCVTHTYSESAARRMSWPTASAPDGGGADAVPTSSAIRPSAMIGAYPSVGGDILEGTSPAELAAARAAVSEALTRALAKP